MKKKPISDEFYDYADKIDPDGVDCSTGTPPMRDEYDFSDSEVIRRGPVLRPDAKFLRDFKLDLDLYMWLRTQSREQGLTPDEFLENLIREAKDSDG